METRELPTSEESCPQGVCKGDGMCDVYQEVYTDNEEDAITPNGFKGYARYKDTEWCSCTLEMCMGICPNSALCGNGRVLKWLLDCRHGRCTTCDTSIGGDLDFRTGLVDYECPVCMEPKNQACVFPDCPAKHTFCLDCMKKLIWGVPNPRYNPDDSGDDEHYLEGSTNACPTCRHRFDWTKDWSNTDRVPFTKRQRR